MRRCLVRVAHWRAASSLLLCGWACCCAPLRAAAADACADPVGALPAELRARYVTAERLLLDGDAESAADYVDLLLARAPGEVAVLELGARVYHALDETEQVDELVDRVREACPERTVVLDPEAPSGPLEEARALYQEFLQAPGGEGRGRRLAQAIAAYEALQAGAGPAAVEAHHALAVLDIYGGRPAAARAAYVWLAAHGALQAAEVPAYLRVLRSLASAGDGAGDDGGGFWREASTLLATWHPRLDEATRAQADKHLGFLALQLDRQRAAREALEASVAGAPDDGEAHYGLALADEQECLRLRAAGDRRAAERYRAQALEHARRAVRHPRYGEAARALMGRLQFDG